MSLVFRNALMPSENQQVLRLRLVYFMPRFFIKNKFARLATNIIIVLVWLNFAGLIFYELLLGKTRLISFMYLFEYRPFIDYVVAPLLLFFMYSFFFFPPLWLTWYLWIKKRENKSK